MVWMLEGSGHEAHQSPVSLSFCSLPPPFFLTRTQRLPSSSRCSDLTHSLTHTAWCAPPFFSTWGSEGGQERRTKANWNAPVSAFLTWYMAHEMQPGPACCSTTNQSAVQINTAAKFCSFLSLMLLILRLWSLNHHLRLCSNCDMICSVIFLLCNFWPT